MKSTFGSSPFNPSTPLRTGPSAQLRPNLTFFVAVAILLLSTLAVPMLSASRAVVVSVPAAQVSEARLAKGTEGLLRQTAEHLSNPSTVLRTRMQGGASIGGFPGFEPPKDDKEYQRRIREQDYNAQDVNDWVKEINNSFGSAQDKFLSQIVKKNPGMSLREILEKQGLTPAQIDNFIVALQRTHFTADVMKGLGVSDQTVKTLTALLKTLGVPTWMY